MSTIPEFEKYPFRIEPLPADEGGGFVIRFPDLPGCLSDGATYEETIANGRDAFQAWMEAQIEDGKRVPEPNEDGEPAKFVQRLPQYVHAQLIKRAAAEGVSMNTLVTAFVVDGLAKREATQRLDTLDVRMREMLVKFQVVESRADVGSTVQLLTKDVSGYPLGKTPVGGFAQVGSGGNVVMLPDRSKAKEAMGR